MPRVKLRNGQVRDQIRQPIFDTLVLDDSLTTLDGNREFFSSVQGKASYLTNLRQNNLLEQAVSFRVLGLQIDAHTNDEENKQVLAKVLEHSAIDFKVGEKSYWQGPMRFPAGRMYHEQALAGGTDADVHFSQYGAPQESGVILGNRDAVDIPPLQSFRVLWTVEGLGTSITIDAAGDVKWICSLKGLQRRPVQ